MNIIVNARFLTQSITGVQRFAVELSKRLKEQWDSEIEFVSPRDIINYEIAEELNAKRIGYFSGHLWEQIDLPIYLKKRNGFLINLCNTAPFFYKNQIVTHHDITYIKYPKSFSKKFIVFYKLIVPLMLINSRKIITVSKFSRNEISDYYGIPREKFTIIYNGVDKKKFTTGKKDNSSERKYILAVSSQNFHKNFHGLIQAFQNIKDYLSEVDLLIVGSSNSKSFNNLDLNISNLEEQRRIHFLGRVDDEELVQLYQNTWLFIFPSLYEGFGIPPLEAQACGSPVIVSDIASMPEVLGDSVLYFDPFTDSDLENKILLFYNNITLREKLIKKGIENIEKFSWEKSAETLCKMIRLSILQNKAPL
ncbi:glycosyltransferase family 1 protein [uncultured Chryseobacterium sp.]|uniref:glycosyltransferase family 4 protein n=1 Tax=uncultured Chryseobacterium sp. TaxID=259322 RepID=UPI0025FCBEF1|nr:glycosyltransferase family 1 protein [uncultured Chryseobacterium sp.]